MSKFSLKKQINTLYAIGALSNLSITGAWVVILAARGFSLVQIGFAETVFHITSLIMEIPSGMLADVYGRKRMLTISRIMAILGDIVMFISKDFTLVCLSMPFHAMSYNFASGSGEALAYDSMKLEKREAGYEKYASNLSIIYRVTSGISTLLAGLALYLGYRKAYLISALMGVIGLLFTLALVEVKADGNTGAVGAIDCAASASVEKKNSFAAMLFNMGHFFADSIRFLFANKKATVLMFLNSFVGAIDILLLFFLQSKLKTAGISNVWLGPALLVMELGGVIGARLIIRAKNVRYYVIFTICTIGVFLGVLLEHTAIIPLMVLGGVISSMSDDVIQIRTDAKLQDIFPSEQRATLVSISSFTFSVVMIVLSPLAGFFFEIW